MSNVAKFDCSSGDSYAQKSLAASSSYTVTIQVAVPATTLTALVGDAATTTAYLLLFGDLVGDSDGIVGNNTPPWQWLAASGSPGGTLTADTPATIVAALSYVSGTTWSIHWTVNGSSLATDSENLGVNDTVPLDMFVGGISSFAIPDEVYYVLSVEVKDHTGSVVFSDDFSSGNLSAWDSTSGSPAIVANPFSASPGSVALISEMDYTVDLAHIYNSATAMPQNIADADIAGQTAQDTGSIATYGVRDWSAENLIVDHGEEAGTPDANAETLKFATYYKDNYAAARTRITRLVFRAASGSAASAANWALVAGVEIGDIISVTTTHPGGGGFTAEDFFVEGIHYEAGPSGSATYADVTLTLDVSPRAYFTSVPDGWT